ncbi:MAG: amidohydrolase family protein [Pirellulales bacterium]
MPTKSTSLTCIALMICSVVGSMAEAESDSFALRARRILPVAVDLPTEIENGVIVVREGRIVALGTNVKVPPDLSVIEFPNGVVVPGFVAAASDLGGSHRGDESVAAGYRAVDAFDRYANYARTLAAGVTTVHVSSGSHRLLTGQGAIVKLAGAPSQRLLRAPADLVVNLGVYNPPADATYSFPASADVAIPVPLRQRPHSRMGQFLALEEAVRGSGENNGRAFHYHRTALERAWHRKLPLRFQADRAADLLGTIHFLDEWDLEGYVVGGAEAARVAEAIRSAELPLVYRTRDRFRSAGGDLGTDPHALTEEAIDFQALNGIRLALAPPVGGSLEDLRLVAVRASRAGLGKQRSLEAITRVPAEILGIADRVGSLAPGKDADLLVMTGDPLEVTSHVQCVFVQGQRVFEPPSSAALVIRAGTIWAKPDEQISDGEILVEEGKIVAVGRSVPHPPFARVIDMGTNSFVTPGFIDGHSHLGLEGDRTAADNAMRFSDLAGVADIADRRVCLSGITTVLVAPYAVSSMGSPFAAIKTDGTRREERVVRDPAAVLFDVSQLDPLRVAETLGKPLAAGKKYLDSWVKYEKDLKEFLKKKEKGEPTKTGEDKKEEETKEAQEPDPITGTWETTVTGTPMGDVDMTIVVHLLGSTVEGRVTRSSMGFTGTLTGTFDGKHLSAEMEITMPDVPGPLHIEVDLVGEDHFKGSASVAEFSFPIEGRRIDKNPVEFKVTRRRLRGKDGRPLPPKVSPSLEPLKALLEKKIPAVVKVSTPAQIREVLELLVDKQEFAVTLLGAEGAEVHAVRLVEKKVTVVVPPNVLQTRHDRDYHQADRLARRGVPMAFQSNVEDGARHLPAVVLFAVERGLDPEKALAAFTIEAARAFKIDSRIGSIEPGKDADLVIFSGHPFREAGRVLRVVVSGKEVRP